MESAVSNQPYLKFKLFFSNLKRCLATKLFIHLRYSPLDSSIKHTNESQRNYSQAVGCTVETLKEWNTCIRCRTYITYARIRIVYFRSINFLLFMPWNHQKPLANTTHNVLFMNWNGKLNYLIDFLTNKVCDFLQCKKR